MQRASLIISLSCLIAVTSTAHAECYGDAADQYGCGNPSAIQGRSEGTLERFGGSSDAPIIIDNGSYGRAPNSYDIFSPEEERRMYRRAVLGAGTGSMSGSYGSRSMRANSRALRTFRGRRIGGRFVR
jgi:hypothetical protein